MKKKLSMIVATSKNGCIGKNGKLIYNISSDLKNFKRLTENNVVIMGKNTFESLPNGPLPNRLNIVLTTDIEGYETKIEKFDNVLLFDSLEKAIEYVDTLENKEVFVIGGGNVYKQAMQYASRIYLTYVYNVAEGDTFFPKINDNEWKMTCAIEKSDYIYRYEFRIYDRVFN